MEDTILAIKVNVNIHYPARQVLLSEMLCFIKKGYDLLFHNTWMINCHLKKASASLVYSI